MTTKKVGVSGRFGQRYGLKNRKQVKKIEEVERKLHICPGCGLPKLKRTSNARFECKKCGKIFTGGAYIPQTLVGKTVKRIITQKNASASEKIFELDEAESKGDLEQEAEVVGLAPKENEADEVIGLQAKDETVGLAPEKEEKSEDGKKEETVGLVAEETETKKSESS
ncbi:MAG: 50S ribosomal protein L37ae [Candidatus Diapherotrites archaeon]|nr:50S ribosomal protein L37ae [Candidatus Diapherotrites archaeon]